jgi:purine-binding chemotaxis protein CheW
LPTDAPVTVAAAAPVPRACVVLLGGRPFAVDVAQAREVVVIDAITPVPGAPAPLVGVMNLRGAVLPVVEARPLLGLPVRGGGGRARALVVADGERRAAVLIERVLGLVAGGELPDDSSERATPLDAGALLAAVRRAWDSAAGG